MAEETYEIRLADGTIVQWTAQEIAAYEGEWQVNLTTVQAERLHKKLILHDIELDDVKERE